MQWVRVFGVVERNEDTNVELFRPLLPLPLPCYSESDAVKKKELLHGEFLAMVSTILLMLPPLSKTLFFFLLLL